MYPATDRFFETLPRTHLAYGQIEFLVDGVPVISSARNNKAGVVFGSRESGIRFINAGVAIGAGSVRRIASSITVVDTDEELIPVIDKELLIVGKSEIRIWSGVRYHDATPSEIARRVDTEQVPVFTGPLTDVNMEDYPIVTMEASDRMWYLLQEFSLAYHTVQTQTIDDAIASLLRLKVPLAVLDYNLPSTELTVGVLTFDEQSVPADAAQKMAGAAGWTLYCNPMGQFIADTEPELRAEDVVMEYRSGRGGALIKPKPKYNAQYVKNVWVVTGEATNAGQQGTPYGRVVDDDPESPTYVRQPSDERPRFIHNPLMQTDAQCIVAAKHARAKERGLAFPMDIDIFANPAQERGDVLRAVSSDINQLIIADTFTADVPAQDRQTITGRIGLVSTDE
jgi:hypothetical protein